MKYFITGGAGFLGSSMADRLLQDKKNLVTVIDNFSSGKMAHIKAHLNDKRFKLIEGDILNLKLLKKAIRRHDFVFHFSANPDIAKGLIHTDLDLKLGISATYNVIEAMRTEGVKDMAYSSGSGIYGDAGLIKTNEDFGPLLPISMYGASKLGAESIIGAFCHMFDMRAWIFRFANIVGARQTHGICFDFIKKLKNNPDKLKIAGDGKQSKSYIYVSDAIQAMLFAIEKYKNKATYLKKETSGNVFIFNVGSGDHISVNKIARLAVQEAGLKDVKFAYSGGKRGWRGDVPVVRLDLTKILRLGWKAKYNSLEAIKLSLRELQKEA